jgi:hypothetical protein
MSPAERSVFDKCYHLQPPERKEIPKKVAARMASEQAKPRPAAGEKSGLKIFSSQGAQRKGGR